MKILVAGGAGYLGYHVVRLLLDHGHEVRIFDRVCFSEQVARDLAALPKCELVRGDIRRLDAHPGLLDDVDAVIHLAGLANDPSCDLDSDMAICVNLESAGRLIHMARDAGVRRFVLASSCSVYGKGVFTVLDEESPTNPVSVYAHGKLESENMLLPLKSDRFEPVIARPATLYGWSPRMRFDLAVNQMTATAARSGVIHVFGGGKQWRPLVHVRDAARAFVMMTEMPAEKVSGEIFNLGADEANYQIVDLAERIHGLFDDVKLDIVHDADDLRSYNVQFGKIREVLGFEPEWDIERAAEEIREYLEDQDIDPFDDLYLNVKRMKRLLATPVEEGGEPAAPRFISLAPPVFGPDEEEAVVNVLRRHADQGSGAVGVFEAELKELTGSRHAVAVSSATAAVHLCLVQAGVQPGDEVILPAMCRPSVANTVVRMGARPVFVDVEPQTLTIDPGAVGDAASDRTRAVVAVHIGGHPCDLEALAAEADRQGLRVIEDAAHALGAQYKGQPVGSHTGPACFGVYPVSRHIALDGGGIVLSDEATAETLRQLAHDGMSLVSNVDDGSRMAFASMEVAVPGYKYAMPEASAAATTVRLRSWDRILGSRRRLAEKYRTVFDGIDEVRVPESAAGTEPAWGAYVVRVDVDALKVDRDEFARLLWQEQVGCGAYFMGIHLHRYYRETYKIAPELLPNATAASRETLALPVHSHLTDKNLQEIADAIKKVLVYVRK